MPIIPRIQPRELPKVPAPVLDRNARPSVERANAKVQQAIGGVIQATKPSYMPESAGQGWEGLGKFGLAVAQTGNIISAAAQAQDEATTYRQRFEAKTAMNVLSGEFEAFKAANINNPEKWQPWWDENMPQGIQKILDNPDLTPRAREMIKLESDSYAKLGGLEVQKSALQKTFSLAADANKAEVSMHVADGNYDGAMQAFDYGLKNGFRFPYEKPILERQIAESQIRRRADAENAQDRALYMSEDTLSAGDPIKWREDNQPNNPKWHGRETMYFKLKARNDGYVSDRTTDAADYAINQIYTGKIVTPEQIDRLETDSTFGKFYSPRLREQLKGAVGQFNEKQDEIKRNEIGANGVPNWLNAFSKLNSDIQLYDSSKDTDRSELGALLAQIDSQVGRRNAGFLREELHKKSSSREYKPSSDAASHVNRVLNTIFDPEDGAYKWKTSGLRLNEKAGYKEDSPDDMVKGVPKWIPAGYNEQERLKSDSERAKMHQKIYNWMQQHPDKANNIDAIDEKMKELRSDPKLGDAFQRMMEKRKPQASNGEAVRGYVNSDQLRSTLPAGLRSHAQDFIDAGAAYDLNPKVLASISALETAAGTSSAFRTKRNAMGISDANGPTEQPSVRDSIFTMAKLLSSGSGPYAKARTLDEIGAIYAPVGAGNDPNGTNGGWSEGVRSWMARL